MEGLRLSNHNRPIRVILITDGDETARKAVETAANNLGLRCISRSAGQPTPLEPEQLVELIQQAVADPVVVMLDDGGKQGVGQGERALNYLIKHPDIQVLGVLAVAANTSGTQGTLVRCSIDNQSRLISGPVDKNGLPEKAGHQYLEGDTVEILAQLAVANVVGIGDPGKMNKRDDPGRGAPVTTRALLEILKPTKQADSAGKGGIFTVSEANIKFGHRYEDNVSFLKEELGVGENFDAVCREFRIAGKPAALFFINGLAKDEPATEVMKRLLLLNREDILPNTLDKLLEEGLPHFQVQAVETFDEAIGNILSGPMALVVEGIPRAIIIDVRQYPARQPEEPDIERVIRGSRDGFSETLLVNTALLRRRIRDPKLRTEMIQVGKRSKSDICLCYLKDVANPELVEMVKHRLEEIKIDGLPMAEKSVEELITPGSYWNPLPRVRYTERPDVAAVHILEGHVVVMVDSSPSVIIAPATYFHHLQHAEEYRQSPTPGIYIRWVRFAAILTSLFLGPLWLLGALHPEILPPSLQFVGPQKVGPIPLLIQFLIAEGAIDMMRMAAIHTPTPLGTALGIIAAVLVGEVAVEMGLLTNEVILYTAIAAVGTFATPSFEVAMANRLIRLFLMLMVGFFGVTGWWVGLTVSFILVASTRSFGIPYLWPLVPFNWQGLRTILVRSPVPIQNVRPSILRTLDPVRQTPVAARKPRIHQVKPDKDKSPASKSGRRTKE